MLSFSRNKRGSPSRHCGVCDIVERRLPEDILKKGVLPGEVSIASNLSGRSALEGRRLYVVAEQSNTPRVRDADQIEIRGCSFSERVPRRVSNPERYRTCTEWDGRTRSEEEYTSLLLVQAGVLVRLE